MVDNSGKIEIHKTRETPFVKFDPATKTLIIIGRSSPRDAVHFYHPLINALENYIQSGSYLREVIFGFDYFNLSSSKCLFDILKRIKKSHHQQLVIKWLYEMEDIDMLQAGEDFATLLNINFNFQEVDKLE